MFHIILFVWFYQTAVDSSIVPTTTGLVKGKLTHDGIFNTYFYSYEGIPYAEPPVGEHRFMPSVPKKPWKGLLDATKPGCVCPQPENIYSFEEMSENCLFLNIFTPVNNSKENLPVVIYVHGEDFTVGSGNAKEYCGPELIIKKNIIVVTLNFRLGALGFFSLGIKDATGNTGVKDVLLAIKWVNKNIKNFGGDPKLITIAGQSSGAALVHALLLSEQSTGLFQNAILLGGSATSPKFLHKKSQEIALQLCFELGLDVSESPRKLLEQLKKIDAFILVKAQQNIARNDKRRGFRVYIPFTLTIEIETSTAIITQEPLELIKAGIKQNIPIITGFNNQEGLEIFPELCSDSTDIISKLNKNFELAIPTDIEYPPGSRFQKNLASSIRKFYFNDGNISIVNTQKLVNLITDTRYSYSIDSWIKEHKKRADSSPVYYYVFLFDGDLNLYKIAKNITYLGAAHVDDVGYTFVTKYTRSLLPNIDERSRRTISNRMNYLSNFVRYGNPTPCSGGFIWGEAGQERNHIKAYGKSLYVAGLPYPERMRFWYNVYNQYYQFKEKIMRNLH